MRRVVVMIAAASMIGSASCDDKNGSSSGAAGGDGGSGAPTARAPVAQPLGAVFTQATFSTKYSAAFSNPDQDTLSFDWSGTNCGTTTVEGEKTCGAADCKSSMVWSHPHPPCGDSPAHADATIFLTIKGQRSGKTVLCAYQGAETGTGTACGEAGFDGSTVGPDTNFAHVFYRAASNRCSTIQLVQVISFKKKGTPATIVVPHNDAMTDSGGSLIPYVPPAREDDANGYVVDKAVNEFTSNDPYYGGSNPGNSTTPADLEDRPGNTKPGHKSYYEVCAFCSAKPTDPDFGKFLDCFTWELDADTGHAQKTNPQPTAKPTAGFTAAVSLFDTNHKFTLPGSK